MDNKSAVALTVGLGALGTVLAYYGYNHLNDDDETPTKPDSTDKPTQSAAVSTTAELREIASKRRDQEKTSPTIANNVSLAIKEIQQEKARKDETPAQSKVETNVEAKVTNEVAEETAPPLTDEQKWKNYWKKEFKKPSEQETIASDYN